MRSICERARHDMAGVVYSICSFVAVVVLLGLLLNHASGLATAGPGDRPRLVAWIRWEAVTLAVVGVLAVVTRPRRGTRVNLYTPLRLDAPDRRRRYAKRGLIVLVGLYRPQPGSPAAKLGPADWLPLAQQLDWKSLDLPRSNLNLAIEAVRAHADRLEHCWLLATASRNGQPGSYDYVPVLEKYLRDNAIVPPDCQFHHGPEYNISFRIDDVSVSEETRRVVERVFDEAGKLGLRPRDVAADFTSCPRNMVLGMVLACLDEERDVQFMGTDYDADGSQVGDLVPILYSFAPQLTTK